MFKILKYEINVENYILIRSKCVEHNAIQLNVTDLLPVDLTGTHVGIGLPLI